MLKWLLQWVKDASIGGYPPRDSEMASLIEERRRLAESLASYREFGFDLQVEGCRDRLRRVQARIQELGSDSESAPLESGRDEE